MYTPFNETQPCQYPLYMKGREIWPKVEENLSHLIQSTVATGDSGVIMVIKMSKSQPTFVTPVFCQATMTLVSQSNPILYVLHDACVLYRNSIASSSRRA